MRERGRQTDKYRQTDGQTDIHTYIQAETDSQREREILNHTEIERKR